jgi:hypothetical protein
MPKERKMLSDPKKKFCGKTRKIIETASELWQLVLYAIEDKFEINN